MLPSLIYLYIYCSRLYNLTHEVATQFHHANISSRNAGYLVREAAGNNALGSEVLGKYTEHDRRGVPIYNPHNRSIQLWFYTAYITERIKFAKFYISAFSAFHHTSFYTKKRLHIRIPVYFDHFIRVVYERRYASHMLHCHLCTVSYSGGKYGGRR